MARFAVEARGPVRIKYRTGPPGTEEDATPRTHRIISGDGHKESGWANCNAINVMGAAFNLARRGEAHEAHGRRIDRSDRFAIDVVPAFFCSDYSRMVTGETLLVNAGELLK